jgi:predicted alpha/beta-hydrolase family hydrolase
MNTKAAEAISISVEGKLSVSGLWQPVEHARACYVLAHGAGAGMRHAFLESLAQHLATEGIETLRYQFPYMERGSRRPDPATLCHATVRAAVAEAARLAGAVPLIAGGRSFGGRMTSQAQAGSPIPELTGLVFVGFPLHRAKQPSVERADHLLNVRIPMLFLQGTRDELAELKLLQGVAGRLGERATLTLFDGADHSFHVAARSGRTDAQIVTELAAAIGRWVERHAGQRQSTAPKRA